jgi:hypothetical protein
MLIPIDAKDFRYFVEQKIEVLKSDIKDNKEAIEKVYKDYEERLEEYHSKPWFIRLFIQKPVHPDSIRAGFLLVDFLKMDLAEKRSELRKAERVLASLPEKGIIQISEKEIHFFMVNLEELNHVS